MSLFSRLKDLVRANVHDMASKAADPQAMLTTYIDEATEHVRDFGVEVNRIEARRIELERRIKESEAAITYWHTEAKHALTEGHEDLARTALEREQNEREQTEKLRNELKVSTTQGAELREQYEQLQEQLTRAKEKRDELVRRNRTALAQKSATDSLLNLGPDNSVVSFDRVETVVERHEAEAKASFSVFHDAASDEFEDLKKLTEKSKVDEAFAKLRNEVNGQE